MSNFYIKAEFTDGEMWALLHALDVVAEHECLTEEQWELVDSAREKLLDAVE